MGYDDNGNRKRKYKTVNCTKKKAQEIKREMEKKYLNTKDLNDEILLKNHLKEFIDNHSRFISENTETSYRRQIDAYIIPHLGEYKLRELNTKVIDDFYTEMLRNGKIQSEGGLSKRSVRYLHTILNKALEKAKEWDRLKDNPARNATPPKRKRYKNKKVDPDELIEIVKACKDRRYKQIYEFTLRTGLRRGETLGLTWKAIDWDRNVVSIMQNLQKIEGNLKMKDLTKNDNAYNIPAGNKVIKLLKNIKQTQGKEKKVMGRSYKDDDLVFAKGDGSPYDPVWVSKKFSKLADWLGYNYTFHDLRHGFGAIQIRTGTHTKTLQKLMNHKSERTTADIYSHIAESQKTDAANKVDNYF